MALSGYTCVQIAKQFNKESIKRQNNLKWRQNGVKINREVFEWHKFCHMSYIKNEIYIGNIVYGKYYKKEVGGKNYLKPRSEWKVYHNHHKPIITQQVLRRFKKIQKIQNHMKFIKSIH